MKSFLHITLFKFFTLLALLATPLLGNPVPLDQDARVSASISPGEWVFYQVEIPAASPGWRIVLAADDGFTSDARLYVHKDTPPTTSQHFKSTISGTPKTIILNAAEATAGTWYIGVYHPGGVAEDFTLGSQTGWLTDIAWDPGSAELGSETFTIPADDLGGLHHFRLTTQAPVHSLWRQVVHVTSGEADLYVQINNPATTTSFSQKSETPGSDGLVRQLSSTSGGGQTWYLAVNAQRGSEWSVFAGDIHLRDLGTLAADATSGSGPDTMPIEGWRFYTTTIPSDARAWRMWLQNGAGDATWAHDFRIRRGAVAHPNIGTDRTHNGQALEAPPYIAPDVYHISITGEKGQTFQFDSRQQEITDLAFGANTGTVTADGFLFHTYRVIVPPENIGWEVTARTLTGDPDLAVRRDNVAVPRDNDAFSEVVGAFDDSIALVQPQLADGEFLITVHSTAPYSYDLLNREPVLTDIPLTGSTVSDDPARAGWRYFRIIDINAQLGHLGWALTLADQFPGTELAIRRNALPGRWERRSNSSPSTQAVSDQSSTTGTLQRPGQQADIWYLGVHRPAAHVGAFTLNTAPIVAPTAAANGHAATVTGLPGGDWSYHRIDVPETFGGLPVLGWEIRLDSWSGSLPAIAVRRSLLPEAPGYSGFTTTTSFSQHPARSSVWPSGWQLGKNSGDMTGRNASFDNSQSTESYRFLLPMGQPVEPGSYYIGFRHTSAPPATFTWSSNLIAASGSGAEHSPAVLPFGGSVSGTLGPRDFKIHTLEVPPNTPSQRIRLVLPENHEARLHIRHQQLPNSEGNGSSVHDPTIATTSSLHQTILAKPGGEHFIQLPRNNDDFILPGTYFLTVVAEGQSPPATNRIGIGGVDYTLEHLGTAPVEDIGTLAPAGSLSESYIYAAGVANLHRFTIPAGLPGIEVRLENRTGNPSMGLRRDTIAPAAWTSSPSNRYGLFSGRAAEVSHPEIITLTNPAAGEYSLSVGHDGTTPESGGYTLTVNIVLPPVVSPDASTTTVTGLPTNEWAFYRIDIPAEQNGHPVLGWELRVAGWSGANPHMVVRRDLLPESISTIGFATFISSNLHPARMTTWPSAAQLVTNSGDLTGRTTSAIESQTPESYQFLFPMGQPLEPGTYYIGFRHTSVNPSTFTWTSRLVGPPDSGFAIETSPLAVGGSVAGTLAPREIAFHTLEVPAETPSQSFALDLPTGHEARLIIRQGIIANSEASGNDLHDPTQNLGTSQQTILSKSGGQHFIQLPRTADDFLIPGTYHLAVVALGQNPTHSTRIGTGEVDYTLTHTTPHPVADLGTLPAGGTLTEAHSYNAGVAKLHRFTIPAGVQALEVRLDNRVGSPSMGLLQEAIAPGNWLGSGGARYGIFSGRNATWTNNEIITLADPAPGVYSLVVGHNGSTPSAGSYDLVVSAIGATPVAADAAATTVTGLAGNQWTYFRIDIPATYNGHPVLGWDVRVSEWTGANPHLVIRRDLLPESTGYSGMSSVSSSSTYVARSLEWLPGWQIGKNTGDLTGRLISADGSRNPEAYGFLLPMGQPLEPGAYFIGFRHTAATPATFTWKSNLIGPPGSGFGIETSPLAPGGSVSGTLAPREIAMHTLEVPPGLSSQAFALDLPAGHEARLFIRGEHLVHTEANANSTHDPSLSTLSSFQQTLLDKEGGEHFIQLPAANEITLTPGTYHLAVVSLGQNPLAANRVGTGDVDYTLSHTTSHPVIDLGTAPVSGTLAAPFTYPAGVPNLHRFTLPAGVYGMEVLLEDPVGKPSMAMRLDEIAPGDWSINSNTRYGLSSGRTSNFGRSQQLFTRLAPDAGTYSLTIGHEGIPPLPGGYTLRVNTIAPASIPPHGGSANTGPLTLLAGQVRYFTFEIPATFDEGDVLGWKLALESTGNTRFRARLGEAATGGNLPGQTAWRTTDTLIVPEFLTPGTWFVALEAVTDTVATLTSSLIGGNTLLREFTMPEPGGSPDLPGLDAGLFGDTGIDPTGVPLANDQGIDLPAGQFHTYAIDVPEINGGLLRTVLEALGGGPDLYIRPGLLPSLDHLSTGATGSAMHLHRLTGGAQTSYGSWVPFNVGSDTALEPGLWFISVHASGSTNARYRLRLGHHADPVVRPLDRATGSFSDLTVAASDWRYFRVEMPADLTAIPAFWTLTLTETQGDVVMYLRDTAPPGQWMVNTANTAAGYSNPRDWHADGLDPGNYRRITATGPHVIDGQDLRPGKPYYIGIRAAVDSTFSISSSVSEATVGDLLGYGDIPTISASGGQIDVTIPPGETRAWRVLSPEEATRWRHLSTHTGGVQVYLRENFLPTQTAADLWLSDGGANTSRTASFGSDLRPREFFLAVVNTSGQPQPYTALIDWRQFTVSAAASGPGGVAVSPVKALYEPGESVTLTATPDAGFQFNGWSGTASGTQNPLTITLTADQSVTANFGGTNHELTIIADNGFIVPVPEKATYEIDEIVTLSAVPAPGREFAGWFGAIGGMINPRPYTVTGPATIGAWFPPVFDSNEIAAPCLDFARGGDGGRWFLQPEVTRPDRPFALRGGAATAGDSHWIETTVEGPGTLSYWRHVSSAPGAGEFRVSLDGGAPVSTLSGEHAWEQTHIAIPAGFRTVRWEYAQTNATLGGENAAFLDEVTFVPDAIDLASWHVLATLDPAKRGPLDRNGPLNLPNLFYHAMALDPAIATPADLPTSRGLNPAGDRVIFRYRRAIATTDTTLTPLVSTDLATWDPAVPLETHIIEQCQRHQTLEIHLARPTEDALFLRLQAVMEE